MWDHDIVMLHRHGCLLRDVVTSHGDNMKKYVKDTSNLWLVVYFQYVSLASSTQCLIVHVIFVSVETMGNQPMSVSCHVVLFPIVLLEKKLPNERKGRVVNTIASIKVSPN